MSNYPFIFCVLLHFLSPLSHKNVFAVSVDDVHEESTRAPKSCAPKYSAVLFLADPTEKATGPIKRSVDSSFDEDFFKLEEKCRVKHCTSSLESEIGDSVDSILRFNRGTCKCDELLKTSLLSLINYCRDTLGMTTAMVSIANNSFSSDIRFRNAESHIETHNPENDIESTTDGQLELTEPPLLTSAKNVSVREDTWPKARKVSSDDDMFPLFELFNPERRMKFNDINNKHKTDKRSKLEIITAPEHTEVFKIRSKRNAETKPTVVKEVQTYNKEGKPKSIWDILNVMENIRLSFFNNILDDENERLSDEGIDVGTIGSISEISLFDIVQKTLTAVTSKNDSAFLMVVIGGRLSDKCDPYSPLMQSIKYVIETTNEESTLIVLTGYCPKSQQTSTDRFEIIQAGTGEVAKEHPQIPVYARGCKNKIFEESRELYDVPAAIKKFLTEKNGGGGDNTHINDLELGDDDPLVGEKNKRGLLDRLKRCAREDNAASVTQVIVTYAAVAALFIFCF